MAGRGAPPPWGARMSRIAKLETELSEPNRPQLVGFRGVPIITGVAFKRSPRDAPGEVGTLFFH